MVDHSEALYPGLEIVPGYRLVAYLGGGGEGEVWKAQARGGNLVAVKIVHSLSSVGGPKQLDALRLYSRISAHVHLCPLHCFYTRDQDGRLLEEGTLDQVSDNSSGQGAGGPVPPGGPSQLDTASGASDSSGHSDVAGTASASEPPTDDELRGTLDISRSTPSRNSARCRTEVDDQRESAVGTGDVEQLILVMGLGEKTLYDRLVEIRREAGLVVDKPLSPDPEKQATVLGMDAKETIHYLRGAASGIDYLNQSYNVNHSDIKPQNILIVSGGAQICDFGLANQIQGDLKKTQVLAAASLAYAAPEALRRKRSRSLDQYSLATTYFELRTGQLPFELNNEADITTAKCTGDLDFTGIPEAEQEVLAKAMDVDPESRYESCIEFIDALEIASGVAPAPIIVTAPRTSRDYLSYVLCCVFFAILTFGYFNGFFSGPSGEGITSLVEEAAAEQAQFVDYEPVASASDYELQVGPLQRSTKRLEKVRGSVGKAQWAESIQQKIETGCEKWLTAIEKQIFAGGLGSNESIANDLGLIKDRANVDDNHQLYGRILLARARLRLLDQTPMKNSAIATLRLAIWKQEDPYTVLTLALTHSLVFDDREELLESDDAGNSTPSFQIDPLGLDDFPTARNLAVASSDDVVPAWCQALWEEFKPRLIARLKEYSRDDVTGPAFKKQISEHWPSIDAEIGLNEIDGLLLARRFDEFSDEVARFDLTYNRPSLSSSLRQRHQLNQEISKPIGGIESALATIELIQSQIQDGTESASNRQLVNGWIEMVCRDLDSATCSIDQATKLLEAVIACLPDQAILPGGTITLFLASLVHQDEGWGDPESQPIDTLTILNQLASSQLNPMIETVMWELAKSSQSRLDSVPRSVRRLVENPSRRFDRFPVGYQSYLSVLVDWYNADGEDWVTQLADLQMLEGKRVRDQLGTRRCGWIASALVEHAKERSGIEDSNSLLLRYQDKRGAYETVNQARWWAEQLSEDSLIQGDIQLEDLLFQLTGDSSDRQYDMEMASKISTRALDAIRGSSVGRSELQSLGQLVRCAYEVARREDSSPSKILVLGKGCLDIGLGTAPVQDIRWYLDIIQPGNLAFEAMPSSERTQFRTSRLKFAEHYLRTGDSFVVSEYLDSSDAPDGALADWRDKKETYAVALARISLEKADQLKYWLAACGIAISRKEAGGNGWTNEMLQRFRDHATQAQRVDANSPLASAYVAYGDFQFALKQRKRAERVRLLQNASKQFSDAIPELEKRMPRSVELYNALWRHGNALVNRVFETPDQAEKLDLLERARVSAQKAIDLIDELGPTANVIPESAYLTLGNVQEDIAHYCGSQISTRKRYLYFNNAINAFRTAAQLGFLPSLKSRYSQARCSVRFSDAGGDVDLNESLRIIGSVGGNESASERVKYHGWKAQLLRRLKDVDGALLSSRQAYELATGNEGNLVDPLARNESIRNYATILIESGGEAELRQADAVLKDQFDSLDTSFFWRIVANQITIIARLNRTSELAALMDSVTKDHLVIGFQLKDQAIPKTLFDLSAIAQKAAAKSTTSTDTETRREVTNALQRLVSRIDQAVKLIDEGLTSRASVKLLQLTRANHRSLLDLSFRERIANFLDALGQDGGKIPELLDAARSVRETIVTQFTELRLLAPSGPDSLAFVMSEIKKLDREQLARVRQELIRLQREQPRFEREVRGINGAIDSAISEIDQGS